MIALVIDQGLASGFCLTRARQHPGEPFTRTAILEYGCAKTPADRAAVVQCALKLGGGPMGVTTVHEDHTRMPIWRGSPKDRGATTDAKGKKTQRSTQSVIGQGVSLGRWLERFDDVGIPKEHQLSIAPSAWRARVLGGHALKLKRDDAKREAVRWAQGLLSGLRVSNDTAESIAMAAYVFGEMQQVVYGKSP